MTWFKSLRGGLKQIVFSTVEGLWWFGYAFLGQVARYRHAPPSIIRFSGRERVLIIAPHPDDETLGAGGTALLHRQAGDDVALAVLTDGRSSWAGARSAEAMVAQRREEIQRAARRLDCRLYHLNLPEDAWEISDAAGALQPLVEHATVIYTPSCIDFHPEHLKSARVIAGLVRPEQTVRIMELGVPLTAQLVNRIADTGTVQALKQAVLSEFTSQQGAIFALERIARYRAAYYRRAAVEVFWELDGAAFARMMQAGDRRGNSASPFRGIRPRPFSDPLAALSGYKIRRRLKQSAGG